MEIEGLLKQNEQYLAVFQTYLEGYGLSERIMNRYLSHVEHYLNDYLALKVGKAMQSGIRELHPFMMTMDSQDTLEKTLKSIKLFYRCMHDTGYINHELYAFWDWVIKEYQPQWIERIEKGLV